MREINILGLKLWDYALKEKMRLVDGYLKNGALNTIVYASTQTLLNAEKDEQQKQWLEAMDMIVYGDADIVHAAGITARSRLKEIENNSFLKELLKKLVHEKRTVYLLADTAEGMELLGTELEQVHGVLRTVGGNILPEDRTESSIDEIINDINDKAPAVILALFQYPGQEAFVFHNKTRINADIWVGLQKDSPVLGNEKKGLDTLIQKLQKGLFRRKVQKYENREKMDD